jgi:hypothetical protein|nr:MAG TPA: hypothetical protein [Bacteriophage sp.]
MADPILYQFVGSSNVAKAVQLVKANQADAKKLLPDGQDVEFLDSDKVIVPIDGRYLITDVGSYLVQVGPNHNNRVMSKIEMATEAYLVPKEKPVLAPKVPPVTPGSQSGLPPSQPPASSEGGSSQGGKGPKQGGGPAQGTPPAAPPAGNPGG